MAPEQDATALNEARDARRESEVAHQKTAEDAAKLGWAIIVSMSRLGVSLGLVAPEALAEEVRRLPDVVWELELATARRVVH
jgi:hypothetical protein